MPQRTSWTSFPIRFVMLAGLSFVLAGQSVTVKGQEPGRVSPDGLWTTVDRAQALARNVASAEPWIQPVTFHAVSVDRDRLLTLLATAPLEFTRAAQDAPLIVTLPMPDGSFARFAVEEAPMMEPALAAKFPEIKTYRGRGLDDPYATVRFDWTPQGFHAQILSPKGAVYIDPTWRGDWTQYASYAKRDYRRDGRGFECLTQAEGGPVGEEAPQAVVASGGTQILRKYRLACAATGEYTAFHGGTVNLGLAAIVTAMNRVNGIYETEVAATMVLVANNNLIVYTNAGTDPYTNSNGGAMLTQNVSNLNSVIGSANYDIGHVFSTGGGGVASLGVICSFSSKARGVTGQPSPIGDPFWVDYVAHEMGHQFGANHCFNGSLGSCSGGNRNGSTAYEPGSGATIMAYAGICGSDNLQSNSDPYFHFISQQEIRAHITGSGGVCAQQVGTTNSFPDADAGPDYVIPAQTPFSLKGGGSDPDLDPVTYCWEQRDLGAAQTLSAPDNGTSPLFRSFEGTEDPVRVFPKLSSILNNTNSLGEKLPTQNRAMDFRLTVRDNRPDGGAFATDNMVVTVNAASGPFRVTAPTSGTDWSGVQSVLWNVANTNNAPVSAANVNILLSTDGGLTFPTVLGANVPNSGAALVTIPDTPSNTARIKVEGAGNIFFDISDSFNIVPCIEDPGEPLVDPSGVDKNRYLSFEPNNGGFSAAYRITIIDLPPPFEAFEGEVRWVGAPANHPNSIGGTFDAAPGQFDLHFDNWTGVSVVHVFGDFVVPGGEYEVQSVQCDPENEADFSPPLTILTAKWGDVIAPFGGGAQPNLADVNAVVNTFIGMPTAPPKPSSQLRPNVVDPAGNVDLQDATQAVNAFLGLPYPFAGPSACP